MLSYTYSSGLHINYRQHLCNRQTLCSEIHAT